MKITLPPVFSSCNFCFRWCLFITAALGCTTAYGSITIDSVTTLPSSCANNGSITVYAQSSSTPILYGINSGPATHPLQSSSQIGGLAPGTYGVIAVNYDGDTAFATATVTGHYKFPDFTVNYINPFCPNTGVVIGVPDAGTGDLPYTWELTNTGTGNVTTQASDTFTGLAAGTYSLRMYDSCQSYTTEGVTLVSDYQSLSFDGIINVIYGCDSVIIQPFFISTPGFPPPNPLTVKIKTSKGTIQKQQNLMVITDYYILSDTVPGVSYGDTINVTVTDVCGNVISQTDIVDSFTIILGGFVQTSNVCSVEYEPFFNISTSAFSSTPTFSASGINYIAIDSATGKIADSGVLRTYYNNDFFDNVKTNPLLPGTTYTFTFTNSCGQTYKTNITTPSLTPKNVQIIVSTEHCTDSTASCDIDCSNFPSVPTIRFLSGPEIVHSTKHLFDYSDSIDFYNKNYLDEFGIVTFSNLGVGKYVFQVTDTCGDAIIDSFNVTDDDLGVDNLITTANPACPGQNELLITFTTNSNNALLTLTVTDLANGQVVLTDENTQTHSDTVYNVNYTNYAIYIDRFNPYVDFATSAIGCLDVYDTVTIPPYTPPVINYVTVFKCNGQLIVILNPDSNNGVPPYQYEIINGPQTFPLQESNVFVLTEKGTYIARIIDTCANAETYTFVVDTVTTPVITLSGSPCLGNNIALIGQPSPYFTYVWQRPNGSVYRGDSLYITPITDADTGLYNIIRINQINGCIDSTLTTYMLTGSLQTTLNATVCTNEGYTFGGKTYTTSGVYRDTLPTAYCDSIVTLNLNVVDHLQDSTALTLCGGEGVVVGVHTYTQTGVYRDTFVTAYCDSIHILNLTVNQVLPDSTVRTICSGQSVVVGSHTYNTTGIYHDTLSSVVTGCDSIIISNLTFGNYTLDSVAQTVCTGQQIVVGTHTYTETGIYRDTFLISGCDSLHVLNLTVDSLPPVHITAARDTICAGDSTEVCAPAGYATYQWNVPGAGDCIQARNAGNYYVTVTDGNNCTAESETLPIRAYPVSSVSIIVFGDTLSSYNAVAYQWLLNDSLIAGATDPLYIARQPGNYTLQITDTNGCVVLSEPVAIKLTCVIDLAEEPTLLYPNPSSMGSVRLTVGTDLIGSKLEVSDEEGRLVYQSVISNRNSEIPVGNLPNGVYLLRISSLNQSIVRRLIRL